MLAQKGDPMHYAYQICYISNLLSFLSFTTTCCEELRWLTLTWCYHSCFYVYLYLHTKRSEKKNIGWEGGGIY